MRRKKFKPPELVIDYSEIVPVEDFEPIILTDKILKEYKLKVDKTKIENFKDINFISIFE